MTTWNIDQTHSTVGFSIRHMVFSKVRGSQDLSRAIEIIEEGTRKA